jgi:hypothetical protein
MFTFTIVNDDGEKFVLTAGTRDILKYERSGGNIASMTSDSPLVEQLTESYKLAHLAAVRTGLFSGNLSKFEDTFDFEFGSDDEGEETDSFTHQAA